MDGIKCHSAITLELMLLDIWIQICIIADLIKYAIDSSVAYLILCSRLLDWTGLSLHKVFVLVWRQMKHSGNHLISRSHIPRIITIKLDYHGFPNDICKRSSHDTMMSSKVPLKVSIIPVMSTLLNLGSPCSHIWASSSLSADKLCLPTNCASPPMMK